MLLFSGISRLHLVLTAIGCTGLISGIGALAGIAVAFYPVENQKLRLTGSLISGLILNTLLALIAGYCFHHPHGNVWLEGNRHDNNALIPSRIGPVL